MAQSAMSTTWDGEWALHSHNLDEWLFIENELNNREVNDPSLKLTKHEIAEQVLHDIEDLGRNDRDDWLDDFALFDELQTLTPVEEVEELKSGNSSVKCEEQPSPSDGSVLSEIQMQSTVNQDLFSMSYENATTFIFPKENILYISDEPFISLTPLQPERIETVICDEEKQPPKDQIEEISEDGNVQSEDLLPDANAPDMKMEMAVVDEIIRNTALELDQWESDTSHSETSSDGTSASDFSPKGEEEAEEETDDPDWKPDTLKITGRLCSKRSKPYRRCGSQEEKTLRKKEQNRYAATRYRQKKKAEADGIQKDEEMLKRKKSELEEQVIDIQRQIKCLKDLMRDMFKEKGIIN